MWAVATNFWIWQWLRGAQAVFFVFFFSHSIKGFHPLGALGGQWANKASAGTRQWFIRERRLGLLFQPLTSEGDGHIICTFPPEREREGRPGRSSQVTASGTWRLPQAEYWGGWHCLRSSQATDAGACCQCHCSCFGVYINFYGVFLMWCVTKTLQNNKKDNREMTVFKYCIWIKWDSKRILQAKDEIFVW